MENHTPWLKSRPYYLSMGLVCAAVAPYYFSKELTLYNVAVGLSAVVGSSLLIDWRGNSEERAFLRQVKEDKKRLEEIAQNNSDGMEVPNWLFRILP